MDEECVLVSAWLKENHLLKTSRALQMEYGNVSQEVDISIKEMMEFWRCLQKFLGRGVKKNKKHKKDKEKVKASTNENDGAEEQIVVKKKRPVARTEYYFPEMEAILSDIYERITKPHIEKMGALANHLPGEVEADASEPTIKEILTLVENEDEVIVNDNIRLTSTAKKKPHDQSPLLNKPPLLNGLQDDLDDASNTTITQSKKKKKKKKHSILEEEPPVLKLDSLLGEKKEKKKKKMLGDKEGSYLSLDEEAPSEKKKKKKEKTDHDKTIADDTSNKEDVESSEKISKKKKKSELDKTLVDDVSNKENVESSEKISRKKKRKHREVENEKDEKKGKVSSEKNAENDVDKIKTTEKKKKKKKKDSK